MHELSVALSILDRAEEESGRRDGARVTAIHARIGRLSGVVSEALAFAFEMARRDSPFRDCRLVIEEVPVIVYCPACQAEGPVDSMQMLCCSKCGALSGEVVRGKELEVFAMEIEEPVGADRPGLPESEA